MENPTRDQIIHRAYGLWGKPASPKAGSDDYYPLPWRSLKYDTGLGGYRTGITEKQLTGAPKYSNDNSWNWSDPARTRSVNDHYGIAM
jgi:hypothetical protein